MAKTDPNKDPLAHIAHKIRTPLTVIMSTVGNLLDGAFGKLTAEQHKWVDKLKSHTESLETQLNDILALLKSNPSKAQEVEDSLTRSKSQPVGKSKEKKKTVVLQELKRPTVLIVDDEADIREIIQEAMNTKGCKTLTASNGDDAIRLALENKPDLILMDVLLENQNGMEICRKIKSQLHTFTPVILVTGQDDLRDKFTGTQGDADDILTKPFQMEELFARASSMLKIKQLHDELTRVKSDDEMGGGKAHGTF